MKLNISQQFEIEQLIIKDRSLDAIKRYREICQCDVQQARQAIEQMRVELEQTRPWYFRARGARPSSQSAAAVAIPEEDQTPLQQPKGPRKKRRGKRRIGLFMFILFAGTILLRELSENLDLDIPAMLEGLMRGAGVEQFFSQQTAPARIATEPRPAPASAPAPPPAARSTPKPDGVDSRHYRSEIAPDADFVGLYRQKISDPAYSARKDAGDTRSADDSAWEVDIKTYRSRLAAARQLAQGKTAYPIRWAALRPELDGKIQPEEWSGAALYAMTRDKRNILYLQTDGTWLYLACDARDETTRSGFDQLSVYLHAGLIPQMLNERVRLSGASRLTSSRLTSLNWHGELLEAAAQGWKQYPITDTGIYRYATGVSSLQGHRQYEMAIHLGEAGLHPGVPFTLSIALETDPLKDDNGKFKQRRYIARLGSQQRPIWMQLETP